MSEKFSNRDIAIPAGLREKWATQLAAIPVGKKTSGQHRLFLFRVGAEWFGIEPTILSMTLPDAKPRRLPNQRGTIIEGLVNADGRVIICLSLERFAGALPEQGPSKTSRILVFSWEKWTFAIRVNEILGTNDVDVEQLDSLPSSSCEALRRCARGIVLHHGRAVICLEPERFGAQLAEALQ